MTRRPRRGSEPSPGRAELMVVAHEMFGARGYHATSMADIAARAYVSKPVLYRYFPGKRDLFLAVAQDAADEMVATIRAALAETAGEPARIDAAIRSYVDLVAAREGVVRLATQVAPQTPPEVVAVIERATATCVDEIGVVVGAATGLPPDSARFLAAGVVGTCTATAQHWAGGRPTDRDELLALVSQLVWQGIAGFPRRDAIPAQVSPLRRT